MMHHKFAHFLTPLLWLLLIFSGTCYASRKNKEAVFFSGNKTLDQRFGASPKITFLPHFFTFFKQKMWKSIFQPAFGMRPMLVKLYNTWACQNLITILKLVLTILAYYLLCLIRAILSCSIFYHIKHSFFKLLF